MMGMLRTGISMVVLAKAFREGHSGKTCMRGTAGGVARLGLRAHFHSRRVIVTFNIFLNALSSRETGIRGRHLVQMRNLAANGPDSSPVMWGAVAVPTSDVSDCGTDPECAWQRGAMFGYSVT